MRQRIKSAEESEARKTRLRSFIMLGAPEMIKHEPTTQEAFRDWRIHDFPHSFGHALFEAISRANLQQTESLRLGFPEYVKIFEDYYSERNSKRD